MDTKPQQSQEVLSQPKDWDFFVREAEAHFRESFKDVIGKREREWLSNLEQNMLVANLD